MNTNQKVLDTIYLMNTGVMVQAAKQHRAQQEHVIARHRLQEDNLAAGNIPHYVYRESRDEDGTLVFDYLSRTEAEGLTIVDRRSPACVIHNTADAMAYAEQAKRERGGNWQAEPVSTFSRREAEAVYVIEDSATYLAR